jgi:OmpA-OmpF porin, OOP family
MSRCSRITEIAFAALGAAIAGCATQSGTVVLLPERDGRPTAVQVVRGGQTLLLDRPYAAAEIHSSGPRTVTVSQAEIDATFGAALAMQPMRPATFTLHFDEGDALTGEASRLLDDVIAAIARYPAPDIVVIGHTDLVGTDAFNDELARKRAESVRQILISRGIPQDRIVALGRGKRDPAVTTADGVAEARNRRAEITVR